MKKLLYLAILAALGSLMGCASHPSGPSPSPAAQSSPAHGSYCPVNLFDVHDVRPCFNSQVACQDSIAKSKKYVCTPQSALKFPPKQP